jgi:putative phage-type endonuclease
MSNTTYLYELEILQNIIDDIVFDYPPSFFTEEYTLDFVESCLYLMDDYMNEYPSTISEPDFEDILFEEIRDIIYCQMEEHILLDEYIEDDIDDLLEEILNIFIILFHKERTSAQTEVTYKKNHCEPNVETNCKINSETTSEKISETTNETNDESDIINKITQKINYLRNIPQPVQRTPEWYQFRHNLITASNAYKAFESQSTINQLIYEKCKPLVINIEENDKQKMVNVNTSLHWGQKYEPLSVLIYEYLNNTKVEDFGCIQHPNYKFIGASPDGINVDKKSTKYGRMLEIKNIVNREITGIPKKEYWTQTQLQMEVCDLDECDFLETKFTEYLDANSFYNDVETKNEFKGVILYFNTVESKPFYLYKPLNITNHDDINEWEEEMIDIYQNKNMVWIKNIYWKLEKISCVLILRNREWFKNNIGQLEKVWKIIEEERVKGYEHRAPNKKLKKISNEPSENNIIKCLLQFNKL